VRKENDRYFIDAVARALDVLDLFSGNRDGIRLTDVMDELGLVKSTAFRLLYTLEKKGYIEREPGSALYRRRRRRRVGLLSISRSIPFVAEVERGIESEARAAGIDLLIRHHEFVPRESVEGAEELLAGGAEFLVLYNPDEYISHIIADRCAQARVPVLAITFPVPGAILLGVNSYRAGLTGGEGLGEMVVRRWRGSLDWVVKLDIPGNTPAQQARMSGMLEGLRKAIRVPDDRVLHLQADRRGRPAQVLMAEFLRKHTRTKRTAVLCYNDINALGALEAVREAKRTSHVLILSQGGIREVREEIRKPRSPLWGAVAHFPERFGKHLIPVIQRMLRGENVPHTHYTEHALLTRSTISRHYGE